MNTVVHCVSRFLRRLVFYLTTFKGCAGALRGIQVFGEAGGSKRLVGAVSQKP